MLQITLVFPVTTQKIFAQKINSYHPAINQEEILTQEKFLKEQIDNLGYDIIEEGEELLEDESFEQLQEDVVSNEEVQVGGISETEGTEDEFIIPEELIKDSNEVELNDNTVDEFEAGDVVVIDEKIMLVEEEIIEEIKPEITQIEFSLDSLVFEDSINAVGETEIFFRYDLSEPNIEIKREKAFLANGKKIGNPFTIENYINQPIILELTLENNEKISATSQPLSIFPDIVINEIYSFGNSSWIEIYNPTEQTVQVSSYKIRIDQDEFLLNSKNSTKEKSCSSFTELKKNEICLVYNDYILNDKLISLRADSLVIDSVQIQDFEYYSSYILKDAVWTETFSITKGEKNIFNENGTLIITETHPSIGTNDDTPYEWIEIHNYGENDIDLTGWYFNDKTDRSCRKTNTKFDKIIIKPGQHSVTLYEGSESGTDGISQSDAGDTIYLCNSQNTLIDILTYPSMSSAANKGKTFGKVYNTKTDLYSFDSKVLTNKTPNDFNIEPEVIEVPDPSLTIIPISDARKKLENEIVTVKGTATVDVNILGDTIVYIQDSTGGIRIDLPTGVTVNISKDQVIQVTGKIDFYHNETEIDIAKIEDIKFSDQNGIAFPTSQVAAGSISSNFEQNEGILVYAEGEIINNYSTSFDIQTGVGVIRVSVLSSTGIDIPEKSKGDYAKITGIFSQYDSSYRILPRYTSDIQIIPEIPPVSSSTKKSTAKPKTTVKATSTKTLAKISSVSSINGVSINNDVNPGINLIKDTQAGFKQAEDSSSLFPIWIIMLTGLLLSSLLLIFRLWKYYSIGDVLSRFQTRTIQGIALQKGYFSWREGGGET